METHENEARLPAADKATDNAPETLDAAWLRELALSCGADDAGFVEVTREGIASERGGLQSLLSGAKSVISLVTRLNRDALQSPWMGIVNKEAAFANKTADDAASALGRRLSAAGIRNVPVHMAFPMDLEKWPGKLWPISHKTIAEEAGLGRMGHHRLVIHPRFGSSVLLSAVVIDRPVSAYGERLAENPCDGCKMCVAACPTGAINASGGFSFVNCSVHNYRYRLGGFIDWVEGIAESQGRLAYRKAFKDSETVSMWQALACGTNYTCLNCLAVCPKGGEILAAENREDAASARRELIKRLKERGGDIFVIKGSDAEEHAEKTCPPERVRRVGSGSRPATARGFLGALPIVFQAGKAAGLDAVFHFDFTGADPCRGTVVIRNGTISVKPELEGTPNLTVRADGAAWVAFRRGSLGLLAALVTRRIRVKGPLSLLKAFARCFPA